MLKVIIYTRPGCHLCEQAAELVAEVEPNVTLEWVDIENDLGLIERYGLRIPVLRKENGAEAGWPLDADALRAFLKP